MNDVKIIGVNFDTNITAVIYSKGEIKNVDLFSNNVFLSTIKVDKLLNHYYVLKTKNTENISIKINNKFFALENVSHFRGFSKFEKMDFIGIEYFALTGLKNPAFIVQGTVANIKNYNFKVFADSKELKYSIVNHGNNSFTINCPIIYKCKNIIFSIEVNGVLLRVLTVKSSYALRLSNRIKSILNMMTCSINNKVRFIAHGIKFLWKEHHFIVPFYLWKKYFRIFIKKINGTPSIFYNPFNDIEYRKWLNLKNMEEEIIIKKMKYNPLISVVIPVYNVKPHFLEECIDSILNQSYKNFEICIVDDKSTNKDTITELKKIEKNEKVRIKYRETNGHISKASNDGINMSKGEYIALVDNDDVLDENALYFVVQKLNEKKYDFVYSDEDKLDLDGKYCQPHFKPDFSPDTLMSLNYICHLSVIKKSIIEKVGGFEVGLEGAQDHDLFLKISEITHDFCHIPKILYHWRISETSTAMSIDNKSYVNKIGIKVIENALKRRKIAGSVIMDKKSGYYIIKYDVTKKNPFVSIIIPTRDYADITGKCLLSLFIKTKYKNFEVLLVNNNSEKKETFDLFKKYSKKYSNFRVIDANFEFNYSKINNIAVNEAKGDYLVLLNNDTEIIDGDWLEIMLGYAMLPHIGAVGPKLLYPDTTIQHAGVILGLGGVASHAYLGSFRDEIGMYGRLRVPYNYSCVTAACLMVKKSKYLEVNGLDESLKVAYNDVDFNIKLLKRGYYNICVPQVEVFHYESKSRGLDNTSEKYKRFMQESDLMFKRWTPGLMNDKFYNPNFSLKGWFVLDKENKKNNNEN